MIKHNREAQLLKRQMYLDKCAAPKRKNPSVLVVHKKRQKVIHEIKKCEHAGCLYKTSINSNMNRHFRNIHSLEKPFSCIQCDFKTGWKSSFAAHMKTHTGEKKFQCTQCSFKSITSSDLKKHMRIHDNYFPYPCTQCAYTAKRKSHLSLHMRVHNGPTMYTCPRPNCNFTKSSSSKITAHAKSHDDQHPFFSCSECLFSGKKKTYLQAHIKRQHSGLVIAAASLSAVSSSSSSAPSLGRRRLGNRVAV